jgi:hypothetical protein
MANEASPKRSRGERLGLKWHDGQRPRRIGNNWLLVVILLITIIAIVLLILSYFYPDTRLAISNML